MNLFSLILYFYKRKIEPGFKVDKNSLVVDIGSGDKPFWRADVFVDKLSLGNVQRTTKTNTIKNLGKFVDSDVNKLPFKNKAFDFAFSSHLLEHVEDPGRAIGEMTRIARSGYLEVPNGVLEVMSPFNSHLWFVFEDQGKLVFYRKSKKLHAVLKNNSINYSKHLGQISEPFIRVYWNKSIKYEIVNEYEKIKYFKVDEERTHDSRNRNGLYILIVKFLRLMFYKKKIKKIQEIYK